MSAYRAGRSPATRRGRAVTALAVLSLALGIAGNTLFFGWLNAFVIEPLPYQEPDRLVMVGEGQRGQSSLAMVSMFTSLATWADYRERSRTLTEWAALRFRLMGLSRPDGSVSVMAGMVTPEAFRVLGVEPAEGRFFPEGAGIPGGPRTAVLSRAFWAELAQNGDPLGSVLTLDGVPYEVVGVLPDEFELIVGNVDLWLPVQEEPTAWPRGRRSFISIARMAPGVTMAQVRAELRGVFDDLSARYPEDLRGWESRAFNMQYEYPDPNSRVHLAVIQGVVFFVLLIACANIAILLLARAEERRKEIAVRAALGAGRLRIVRRLLRESLLMAGLGGVLGVGLAAVAVRMLDRLLAPTLMPRTFQPSLDGTVLAFTAAVTVVAGLTFGMVPALQSLRQDHASVLKSGGGAGSGKWRRRLTTALVTAQVGLCLVALGSGSMLLRAFQHLRVPDPGFEVGGVLSVELVVPSWKHTSTADRRRIVEEIQERAATVPGVRSIAVVSVPPQSLMVPTDTFRVSGDPIESGRDPPMAVTVAASADYLRTMEIPLLRGRFVEPADRADAAYVVAVSQSLVRERFDGGDPVGRRITLGGREREIVGVVGDVQQALVPQAWGSSEETIYVPSGQSTDSHWFLMLRTDGDPLGHAQPVRSAIAEVDPDVTIHAAETMGQYARRFTGPIDFIVPTLSAFGIFGLLLAALGTYGVVSNAVGQRTHEIGVRIAVGARPEQVVGLMASQGLLLSAVGLAGGGLVLIPVARMAGGLVRGFGLTGVEPTVLAGVGGVLLGVTALASVIPALRAARVDPVRVLKTE